MSHLVAAAKAGRSQVLVLRGEPGIGKTALLDHLVDLGAGCRMARAVGIESEMELAFAGLHQLCSPYFDRLESLPAPQREALCTAFGLRRGSTPDRFLVGLAVLCLLSGVAEERPLICVVDDAHWVDRESVQTLAFVARRLTTERIALVFAVREDAGGPALSDFPDLVVPGLAARDAAALVESAVVGTLDPRVRDRIVAESHGNPLALLELPRGLSAAGLAFGGDPGALATPLVHRLEQAFLRQVEPLSPQVRRLLLAAAAEPVGDGALLRRAAERLAVGADAAAAAEATGLIELADRVRFRHPLLRSAVYRSATPAQRREVHSALADVTDPDADPDRRAWHQARAAIGPDEAVAGELERSAERARARGGIAAAAAFLESAVDLTPGAAGRARRALAAAHRTDLAGAPDRALELLATAESGPLEELDQARAQLLHARITFSATHGRDAPRLLLAAARRLEPLDARLAQGAYLDAFSAALTAGREGDLRDVAAAVLAADWSRSPNRLPRSCALLLQGLAVLTVQGHAAGVPLLKESLAAFRDEPMPEEDALRWLWPACRTARGLFDDATLDELSARQVEIARRTGALSLLPMALTERFGMQFLIGDQAGATALAKEAAALTDEVGSGAAPRGAYSLETWRGRDAEARTLIEASREDAARRGEGLWLISADWATAVRLLGRCRYEEALSAAERAASRSEGLGLCAWVLPELIEAAVRSGHPDRAVAPLRRLTELAQASGTDWALGVAARCRAFLADGPAAEALHREAIDRLARTRIRVAQARAHLLYGEWLRREGRRTDAREQLRAAHRAYVEMGLEAFAERARQELTATGETMRRATVGVPEQLTAQEAQVARLAADRLTNPEIGAQLFLSPRTVEWHLRKVFTKLGVTSRRELVSVLTSSRG